MSDAPISSDEVAQYLREHPDFFEHNVELLASISVAHPHGGRAISLQERQLALLRERHRALELRLTELVRAGEENDAIASKLQDWTRSLLLAREPAQLPGIVVEGLGSVFAVPQVAMRLWGLARAQSACEHGQPVPTDTIALADSMTRPYCGPNSDFQAATWLPESGRETRSIALLPLRKGAGPQTFGLLVLGSADPDRFRSGMGTAWLERIAEVASAALARLVRAVPHADDARPRGARPRPGA